MRISSWIGGNTGAGAPSDETVPPPLPTLSHPDGNAWACADNAVMAHRPAALILLKLPIDI
ncbi:hypothetical protein RugamoR57_27920 [Duganella caerulea]